MHEFTDSRPLDAVDGSAVTEHTGLYSGRRDLRARRISFLEYGDEPRRLEFTIL